MTAIETLFPRAGGTGDRLGVAALRMAGDADRHPRGYRTAAAAAKRRGCPLRRVRHSTRADGNDAARHWLAGLSRHYREHRGCPQHSEHPRAPRGTPGTPRTPGTLGTPGTRHPWHPEAPLGTLGTPGTSGTPSFRIEAWLPMLVGVWLAGVSLLTVRLLGGWMWVQRMKRHASTGASRELQGMVVASFQTAAHFADRPPSPVLRGRRADGDRLPAAGDPFSGERAGRDVANADRVDPRTRARAYPPARLPGQPPADVARDAALLSPRGVVAVAPDP